MIFLATFHWGWLLATLLLGFAMGWIAVVHRAHGVSRQLARWLALLGDGAYTLALHLNGALNGLRRVFGLGYWSLSGFLKRKVKDALEYICRFEAAAAREARSRGFDGVICGHIHQAAIKTIEGVLYINDGDWVESCTALAEDTQGHLEILCWSTAAPLSAAAPVPSRDFAPAFPA